MAASPTPPGMIRKTESIAADGSLEAERKASEQGLIKLKEFLKQYSPMHGQGEKDLVDNRYRLNLAQPLPQFDSERARAVTANDIMEPSLQLFAQICESGQVQRYKAIEKVLTIEHRSVLALKAAEAAELSAGGVERFTLVYEKPMGAKLSDLMEQKKLSQNPQFIVEHILMPVFTGLEQFSALDIAHGLINPHNIYLEDKAVLGPCLAEPCGYSQPYQYESIERMQALPSAKGEGSVSQDFYALAVTLLVLLHGPEHFRPYNKESLTLAILRDGAYHALMREREVPEIFYDFLRGTLTQSPEDRWGEKQIRTWLEGKRYNVLPPPPPVDAVRPFEYKDIPATNRRELAYLFASDWEHMMSAFHNNQLAHWVSVSLRNKELADTISRLCRSAIDLSSKNEAQAGEMLMNIVLLLDPQGPVRIRQLAMHVDGLETLCADMYHSKSNQELQFLAKFIEINMINYWLTLQTKRKSDYETPERINNLIVRLDRLRGCIRNNGYGFGLERMLYDLNPDMPCISDLFDNRHIKTLPQLLRHLDRLAPSLEGDDIVDRHISAFIGSKLGIFNEIRLHELSSMPTLATNRIIISLHLIAKVQERIEPMRLPGLTHWFAIRLLPLMDTIHSKSLRQKLKTMLLGLAPLGLTQKIAELLITADFAVADYNGFQKALATYYKNAVDIERLKLPERLEMETQRMGLNIAALLAYGGLLFSILYIVRGVSG